MKHLKKYNEKFDVINIDLKRDIKEYLLTKYPESVLKFMEIKKMFSEIKDDVKSKFLLSEYDFERNNISSIIRKHIDIVSN